MRSLARHLFCIVVLMAFVVEGLFSVPAWSSVTVTVNPSAIGLKRNTVRTISITYSLSGDIFEPTFLTFLNATGEVLDGTGTSVVRSFGGGLVGGITSVPYTFSQTIGVSPSGGAGTLSFAELDAAAADGTGQLWFRQTFDLTVVPLGATRPDGDTGSAGRAMPLSSTTQVYDSFPLTVTIPLNIDTGSDTLGVLRMKKMDLYFLDGGTRKGETTVALGAKGLKAFAHLDIAGSGYLEGRWLVDGQIVEQVRKYASFGQKVILSTSDVPGISTFIPGLHTVQLQITNPAPPFEPPSLVYLVTEKEEGAVVPIAVEGPAEGASVTRETRFAWTPTPRSVVYIATWRRVFDGREVLSAMVKEAGYRAPEDLFTEKFVAGVKYTWQVKGYDSEGRVVSEGPVKGFIAR